MSADKQQAVQATKMCLACNKEYAGDISTCPDDKTALIAIGGREDPYLGTVLADRFEILDIIGKGGMGVVYLARHQVLERLVAIKMLQAELTQDEASVKRFQQEAKAASQLNHPHLISLTDFGMTTTQQPFLVMEYLEGVSLLDVLRSEGPMEPKRAVKIFSEAADGLYHAHTVGILHRDLKPSNILMINHQGDKDFVKIVDFGLAKLMPWSGKESQHLTKTGEVFGSPIYMSPEQCMGKELRPTSDIYSLGITLFEVLTGKPPFRGTNSIQTASKHMTEAPPSFREVRPDLPLPEGLEKVVMKCLQKNPQDRFQDMSVFKDALIAGLNSEHVELPASLMVSTRAIPAVSAQVAAAQSAVRKAAVQQTQVEPEPKKPPHPGIFIGAGVAVLAGIAAACFLPVVPSTTSGTISFYQFGDHGMIELMTPKGLNKFSLGADSLPLNDEVPDNSLGSKVDLTFKHAFLGNSSTGVVSDLVYQPTGKPDQESKAAIIAVDDLLNMVANNWVARFDEYGKGVGNDVLNDNKGNWRYIPPSNAHIDLHAAGKPEENPKDPQEDKPPRKGDERYDGDARPAHAFKIEKTADHDYRVLVDGSHYAISTQPVFWQFKVNIDGDNAKISDYQSITLNDWDKL